jgi:hypothetical protein
MKLSSHLHSVYRHDNALSVLKILPDNLDFCRFGSKNSSERLKSICILNKKEAG